MKKLLTIEDDDTIRKEVLDAVSELDCVDELYFLPFQRIQAEASPALIEKVNERRLCLLIVPVISPFCGKCTQECRR